MSGIAGGAAAASAPAAASMAAAPIPAGVVHSLAVNNDVFLNLITLGKHARRVGKGLAASSARYDKFRSSLTHLFGDDFSGNVAAEALDGHPYSLEELLSDKMKQSIQALDDPKLRQATLQQFEQARKSMTKLTNGELDWEKLRERGTEIHQRNGKRVVRDMTKATPEERAAALKKLDPSSDPHSAGELKAAHERQYRGLKKKNEDLPPEEAVQLGTRPHDVTAMHSASRMYWSIQQRSTYDGASATFELLSPYGVIDKADAARFVFDCAENKMEALKGTRCEIINGRTLVTVTDKTAAEVLTDISTNNIGRTMDQRLSVRGA